MFNIFPGESLGNCLQRITSTSVRYKLYTNNATPAAGSVLADFTECAAAGYAFHEVVSADWSAPIVLGGLASITAPAFNFICDVGADVNCYGIFIVDVTETLLLWAARFDVAPTMLTPGGIAVVPILGDSSRY